ncbi:hypothetical protein LDENG_00076140 [Lucifuga dentata]|nr:hypothetical protein LDENG_00076140 [Lucifuga dentata]
MQVFFWDYISQWRHTFTLHFLLRFNAKIMKLRKKTLNICLVQEMIVTLHPNIYNPHTHYVTDKHFPKYTVNFAFQTDIVHSSTLLKSTCRDLKHI